MKADDDREHGSPGRPGVELLEGGLSPAGSSGSPAGDPEPSLFLRPSIEVFPAGGDLYLLRPGDGDLAIRGATAEDVALVDALALGGTAGALQRATGLAPSVLADKLAALRGAGVLVERVAAPPLEAERQARFDRQLPYFAEQEDPAAAQRRLARAGVLVLGCGGLGTWALGALACTGIGRFVLVDDDTVDRSNLNRQILYDVHDLGEPKAERAAAWIRRFDPAVDVEVHRTRIGGPAELAPLLEGITALVLAADWPPYALGRWVDEACRSAGVPYVMAAQIPPIVKVGPTYVPGRTACFACQERQTGEAFPLYPELSERRRRDPAPATTLGPASGLVGALMAMEVMHLCLGWTPVATEGRAWLLDMRTLETRWEVIERLGDCPACQHLGP